ncbi:MAG: MFS transporter [Candidatus Pacearchaeota archaeon]
MRDGKLKEETKKLSVKEGIAAGIMDGAGVKYITPYALAIGASNAQIGFLTSIPSLLGNFSQLFSYKAIEKFPRKKVIAVGVFLQALMWIPIIFLGYLFFFKGINHGFSATLLILFYTLFTIFGSFISPAWNSLMKDDVDKDRGKYFGNRSRIIDFIGLIVMLVCGFILNFFSGINLFFGFMILFGIAFFSRLISAHLFNKHYEPKLKLEKRYYFSLWQFIKKVPESNFGKFTVGVALIHLGTYIASPFFSVYLLKELNLDYVVWTVIVVFNILGTLLFVPLWGKFADNYGNLKVVKWTGLLIPLIPLLWFFSFFVVKFNFFLAIIYLIGVEVFSGFVWAGFNLCARNFIYDAVTREKLALCISYYNILSGITVFIGATIGGAIASMNFNFFGIGPILFVFLLSAGLRFIFYFVLMPKVQEVRGVKEYKDGEFGRELREVLIPVPFRHVKFSHA